MQKTASLLEFAAKNEIKFISFCFTTTSGRMAKISYHIESVNADTFYNGIPFDGSSVDGWASIESSDMLLMPDHSTAFLDPFAAQPTLCVMCSVLNAQSAKEYIKDPRFTAKKAQDFLKKTGIADKAFFGLEVEFFVLDDARFAVKENGSFFELDSSEGPYNSGKKYEYNNHAQRYGQKDFYLACGPSDTLCDIRAEILETLKEIKLKPTLHHHEVASSQCEVGFYHAEPLESADNTQKCKYVIRGVASSYGKSATFMPKPFKNDNGNGMHIHQSLWKNGKNLFAPNSPDKKISDTCLYYIGGILKHAKALCAFTNPTTNSYKRLVNGYEAPRAIKYSFCNRSAAVRIPHASSFSDSATRIEARFADTCANPYLAISAMLMAGIDGIKNKIHPGQAEERNLFDLHESEYDSLCKDLDHALDCLEADYDFLIQDGVFNKDQIICHIKAKRRESEEIKMHPNPIEFLKYYAL